MSRRPRPRRRRAAPPPRRSQFLSPAVVVGGSFVILAVIGAIIAISLNSSDSSDDPGEQAQIAEEYEAAQARFPVDLAEGFAVGDPDAPLVLKVYEDFQCPFCVRYSAVVEPALIDEFVVPGDLRIEFRNFPILGIESVDAAAGAVCAADQGRFWTYAHSLFLLQVREGQLSNEQLDVGRFDRNTLIDAAGPDVDAAAFEQCLEDPDTLTEAQDQKSEGTELGVRGTPSFALNGQLLASPPQTVEQWRDFLNERLDQQQ